MAGDVTGSLAYVSASKCLNIRALVLGLPLIVAFTITFTTGVPMILEALSEIIKGNGGY